jgi:8-oxo-dGTP diphosphatase
LEVRQIAAAFLFNNRKVLMMRKSKSRLYDFDCWTGLGGHLEQGELNHPRKACIREIYEESGIPEEHLFDLNLRYILIRIKEDEIRQQFVYIGKTNCEELIESDEGQLFWIDQDELINLNQSKIIKFMIEDYLINRDVSKVKVGVISMNKHEEPIMQWSELIDPMVF